MEINTHYGYTHYVKNGTELGCHLISDERYLNSGSVFNDKHLCTGWLQRMSKNSRPLYDRNNAYEIYVRSHKLITFESRRSSNATNTEVIMK